MSFLLAAVVAASLAQSEAQAFDKLASEYTDRGELDRVIDLTNRMLARPGDPNRALVLVVRAQTLNMLNDAAGADAALSEALPLAERSGDFLTLGRIHRMRGFWIWRTQRDLAGTTHEYDLALDYAKRAKAWHLVTVTENGYGNLYRNRISLNPAEALKHYEAGLEIARREHYDDFLAYFAKNMGEVYRMDRDPRSEPSLLEAVEMSDRISLNEVQWMARNQLGLLLSQKDPQRAERYLKESMGLLEAQQAGVLLDDFRPGAFAGEVMFANPYESAIEFYRDHGRADDAFVVAERERARVFLDMLSSARERIRSSVPAATAARERELLNRIRTSQTSLRSATLSDAQRAALVADVDRTENDLASWRLRLSVENPALAHARYPKLITIRDLQSRILGPDEALLSFHIGEARSVAWLITREHVSMFDLPPAAAINKSVQAALAELRDPTKRDRTAVAALSRTLSAAAIAKSAGKPRVVVIPHGILYDIPFEALLDDSSHLLVERFAISYAPSASSLAFLRSMPASRDEGATLIAVANPVMSTERAAQTRNADFARMGLLSPLPKTEDEANDIAGLFGSSAFVLDGVHATRAELAKDDLAHARLLHFATHGLIDERKPERSALVLTAVPPHDDGLLQTRDIYAMRLNADLVTLSACQTALGERVTGEGIIGLQRAFFFAGARSVAASLWDVDDAATARFMEHFYGGIKSGKPIDIALQQAKIDFIHAGGRTASPFFWAPFVVSGNAQATVAVPKERSAVWIVSVAVALALLFVALRRGLKPAALPAEAGGPNDRP